MTFREQQKNAYAVLRLYYTRNLGRMFFSRVGETEAAATKLKDNVLYLISLGVCISV